MLAAVRKQVAALQLQIAEELVVIREFEKRAVEKDEYECALTIADRLVQNFCYLSYSVGF